MARPPPRTVALFAALAAARARWVGTPANLDLHIAPSSDVEAPLRPSPLPHPSSQTPPDEDDDRGLQLAEGRLLPAVHCITYVALEDSKELPLFEAQMRSLGLWDRVTVQQSPPDPDGKAAGCWRSHVRAWNDALARGCEHALILEEDVYFEEAVVEAGMAHANAFIASGSPYDMFFLGYSPEVNLSHKTMAPFQDLAAMQGSVEVYDGDRYQCVYRLRRWLCTQSYIISRAAMAKQANLTYDLASPLPIDYFLSTRAPYNQSAYFTVRPMIGFQRYHTAAKGVSGGHAGSEGSIGSPYETFKFVPGVVYSIVDPELYTTKAGIHSPAACLPPPAAYSWSGLADQANLMIQRTIKENSTFCFPYAQTPPTGAPPLPTIELPSGLPSLTFPQGWPKTCLTLEDMEDQLLADSPSRKDPGSDGTTLPTGTGTVAR